MGCAGPGSEAAKGLRRAMDSARRIFPCFGAIDPEADRRLGDALANNGLTEVRSLRREAHDLDESCLLHGERYCFSKGEIL